jgi:RNA polymerase sigma-70 factor (ECF subfamily)
VNEESVVRMLVSERVKILGFIQSIVRRADIADDVFQDVCVLALEKRENIPDEAHLFNWLRSAARLRALNVLRKRQERQKALDDDILESLEGDWQEHDTDASAPAAEAIRHCIEQLAPAARKLVRMRYTESKNYGELAKLFKRPVASLYVSFSRIHAALADCVSRHLASEGGDDG